MRRPVQDAGKGERIDRGGIVSGLENIGQPLAPDPFELTCRKRRPEGDVRHDRQRGVQACDGNMKPYGQ